MSLYKSHPLIPEQPTAATEKPTPTPDRTATTPASDSTAAETGTATAKDTTPPTANAALADDRAREWILEEEAPEIEPPEAFDDYIEGLIDDSIEERRRRRRDASS